MQRMKYRLYKSGEFFGNQQRYQIIEQISRDHRDEMYRVRDTSEDLILVIKLLPQDFVGNKELQFHFLDVLTRNHFLNHDYIVQALSFESIAESNGQIPFFTMTDIPGQILVEVLADAIDNRLPIERVLRLGYQIGQILDYTHHLEIMDARGNFSKGIFHGCLNPHHIFVSDQDKVFISEFGIAGLLASAFERPLYRHHRHHLYLSPEQHQGGAYDHRADLFALACILFHMLTGSPPDPQRGLCTHLEGYTLEPSSILSREQNDVLAKALSLKPADRYNTVFDFIEAFADAPATLIKPSPSKERKEPVSPALSPTSTTTTVQLTGTRATGLSNKMRSLFDPGKRKAYAMLSLVVILCFSTLYILMKPAPTIVQPESVNGDAIKIGIADNRESTPTPEPNIVISASFQGMSVPADIYLDNEELLGHTPLQLESLPAGTINLFARGSDTIGFISFEYSESYPVRIDIPLFQDSALVSISSPTEQAAIYVDGQETGRLAPAILALPSGKHTLSLRKEGFSPADQNVECAPLTSQVVQFNQLNEITKTKPTPRITQKTPTPLPTKTVPASRSDWRNSYGMTFVRIPAGKVVIGASQTDRFRGDDETTFTVELTYDYYIMTTEVTQDQWYSIMGNQKAKFLNCGGNCPVENVNWYEVQRFIELLNEKTGTDGYRYRLPTEVEWEYAARAGRNSSLSEGELAMPGCSPIDAILARIAWYCGNSEHTTHPVGQKKGNAFGLYDLSGNVMEWCQDRYGDYPQAGTTIKNYEGPSYGRNRVIRGGSWNSKAEDCRITKRFSYGPGRDNNETGFRLVALPSKK
ncbi:SUMF1/EgtB/PvdO family nonheme iron enzyme [bacterium]|nr:SUMF1/EgtB/PvdO family nonheme iron enzyme [bacterium]